MNTGTFFLYCFLLLTGVDAAAGKSDPPTKKIVLTFQHMVGKQPLVLGDHVVNRLGDTISVRKFKYYLSNFRVTDDKGKTTLLAPNYFLVDESDASSKSISLSIPGTNIKSIGFMLGVDSVKNVSGIQSGALDPLKGMFWTWNSGYIMAKLEGSSPSSKIAGQSFTYHIGGFRKPMHTMRAVELAIPGNSQPTEIQVTADIDQWFSNKSDLRIRETPVCHSPGTLAVRIADNYSTMFSITGVK